MGVIVPLDSPRSEANEKSLLTSKSNLRSSLWLFYKEVEGEGNIQYTTLHNKPRRFSRDMEHGRGETYSGIAFLAYSCLSDDTSWFKEAPKCQTNVPQFSIPCFIR